MLKGIEDKVKFEFEQTFMFYLPRICEHCLNPSCAASCPSGAIYKRSEDGIVLVDQDKCRGWRMCVSGCPYKKVYFNHKTGKAEKCTFCYPRIEVGIPTVCAETCVGRLRYIGLLIYDADKVLEAASVENEHDLYEAQRDVFLDPNDPEVARAERRASRSTGSRPPRSPGAPAHPGLQGGAAAAPGVPHHADGLVHPAPVPGRRRHQGDRPRRRGQGQPLRRDRHPPHPRRVPRQPHRRRPARSPRCSRSSRPCGPSCATSTSAATPTTRSRRRSAWTPSPCTRCSACSPSPSTTTATSSRPRTSSRRTAGGARDRVPGRLRLRGADAVFGEGSGDLTPVAVENFRMLEERQTSDQLVGGGSKRAASTCSTGTARASAARALPRTEGLRIPSGAWRARGSPAALGRAAARRLAGDLGPAGLPDAGVGGSPMTRSVAPWLAARRSPYAAGLVPRPRGLQPLQDANATTSRRSTTRASAACT